MSDTLIIDNVLDFWFGTHTDPDYGQPRAFWFNSTPVIDALITEKFGDIYQQAARGEHSDLLDTAEGCLAMVIILDQFPRNMFRDTPQAFATDPKALMIAKQAITRGFDRELTDFKCKFLYMPFMHSELLEDQNEGVRLFSQFGQNPGLDYMILHRDIIARFGRFPHRNRILGRASSEEELRFLEEPNSSF